VPSPTLPGLLGVFETPPPAILVPANFLGFRLEYVFERQAILFHELEYFCDSLLFGHFQILLGHQRPVSPRIMWRVAKRGKQPVAEEEASQP